MQETYKNLLDQAEDVGIILRDIMIEFRKIEKLNNELCEALYEKCKENREF